MNALQLYLDVNRKSRLDVIVTGDDGNNGGFTCSGLLSIYDTANAPVVPDIQWTTAQLLASQPTPLAGDPHSYVADVFIKFVSAGVTNATVNSRVVGPTGAIIRRTSKVKGRLVDPISVVTIAIRMV